MADDQSFLPKPILGTDESVIDSKGRVLLRQKMLRGLGQFFVLYLGDLGCVIAKPMANWDLMLKEVSLVAPWDPGRKAYTRLVLDTADLNAQCDGQGRVAICKRLRNDAKLTDAVLIIGCYDYLEIWNVSEFEKYTEDPDHYSEERRQEIREAMELMKEARNDPRYDL